MIGLALVAGLVLGVSAGAGSSPPLEPGPPWGTPGPPPGKGPQPRFGRDDIGGVVRGARGQPEAGVWVIAETDDFDTRFAKIVVTDDHGRYVIPDLADATYDVWVRGYGLVDSKKKQAKPGQRRNLHAVQAPDPVTAAQYYPPSYWMSLLEVPPADEFPTDGFESQAHWVQGFKWAPGGHAIFGRYVVGAEFHRNMHPDNPVFAGLGLETTMDVLRYMQDAGQITEYWCCHSEPVMEAFAEWIDRIREGAAPPPPPRPQGIERNIVVTTWDAGDELSFAHDIVASDKRDPTVNSNGNVYASDWTNDQFMIVDPVGNSDTLPSVPSLLVDRLTLDPFTRESGWTNPSVFWGNERFLFDYVGPGSLAMDGKGRVWVNSTVHNETAAFCRPGSGNKYAEIDPQRSTSAGEGFSVYNPATEDWEQLRYCFGGNHPTFAVDGTNRVFVVGGNSRFTWVDTDVWDATHDEEASQGWCRLFYDADGDGTADRDFPVNGSPYGPQQSLLDGSIWGAVQTMPGRIIRLDLGDNPPETCVGEAYNIPFDPSSDNLEESGFHSRGIDVDSNGVVWTVLAGSGTLASFDRSKCEGPLTGPEAMTGDHCPEGWTLYPTPGPRLTNTPFNADWHYYNFVDKYDVIGLGPDTPLVTGTNTDSLMALDPDSREWVTFRMPYPVGGMYTRNMSVRVDDPDAGWKGTGLWAANDSRAIWLNEFGKGTRNMFTKFQLRPDPLAN